MILPVGDKLLDLAAEEGPGDEHLDEACERGWPGIDMEHDSVERALHIGDPDPDRQRDSPPELMRRADAGGAVARVDVVGDVGPAAPSIGLNGILGTGLDNNRIIVAGDPVTLPPSGSLGEKDLARLSGAFDRRALFCHSRCDKGVGGGQPAYCGGHGEDLPKDMEPLRTLHVDSVNAIKDVSLGVSLHPSDKLSAQDLFTSTRETRAGLIGADINRNPRNS